MQTCCVSVSGHHTYVHQPWVVFSPSVKQTKQLCGLGRATRASIDTTASRLPGEISISHEQSFSKVNVRASKQRAFSRQPSACFDIWPPRGPLFFSLSLHDLSCSLAHSFHLRGCAVLLQHKKGEGGKKRNTGAPDGLRFNACDGKIESSHVVN